MLLKSAGLVMRPIVRTVSSRAPSSTRPPGTSMFCERRAATTSGTVMLKARILSGSTQTCISRVAPPMISTLPTPFRDSMRSLMSLSAMSVTSRKDLPAETAMRSTGAASVSSFWTMGSSAVSGRSPVISPTLSRTSCAATSAFLSRRNVMKTCETPSTEVERSSSMPLMVLTAASTLSVISVSTSCGPAPGLTTVTVMVGRSIFGKRSTPSVENEKTPTTVSDRINIVANTGRRTQISANFCMAALSYESVRLLSDRDPVGELLDVRGGDELVRLDVPLNLDEVAVLPADRDEALARDAVLDDVDARGRPVRAHGAGGDEDRRVGLRQEHADGGELPGLKQALAVLDLGLDGERARLRRHARRDARDATREAAVGVRAHGDRDALPRPHGRDGLLGDVDADAQRVGAHDRGD